MKKVLLIYPKNPMSFWGSRPILNFIGVKAAFPPLGLLTVAAMLPEKWELKLVDLNVRELSDKDISSSDMVFISFAMHIQGVENVKQIVQRCKDFGKIVVGGGAAFSATHKQFENIDHFVLGEAEITLPIFLRDLKKGRVNRFYISARKADLLKTSIIPMWSLINPKDYSALSVQYTRGCPFNCEFCSVTAMHGNKIRFKSIPQIINELTAIYMTGFRGRIFFNDDNFIGNPKEVKKLLKAIIKWQKDHGFPFIFLTQASINLALNEELMDLMAGANFDKVFLGVETPNEKSLKACGKNQNLVDLKEAIRIIQRHGLQVMGGMIVGFDQDTKDIFKTVKNFLQQTGMAIAMVGMLEAFLGTRFRKRIEKEKRFLVESDGDNTSKALNFKPIMGVDTLIDGYDWLIKEIYSPRGYYKRVCNFIVTYKSRAKRKFSFKEFRAFIFSMWKIGFKAKGFRRFYWKLLIRSFFLNFKAFPDVVELCIVGWVLQQEVYD